MAMRKPLADDELERFFQSDAGSYPFFDGHSTRHLDEPLAQPPPLQCQQGSRNFHLSDKSIARFIETGHIVVKGLVPADQLADWRRQFWSAIGTSPSCPADWPGEGWQGSVWQQNSRGPCVAPLIPCLGHLPSVCAVAEQLGGATLAEGQRPKLPNRPQEPIDHAVTQWPTDVAAAQWTENPKRGHIDGANPPKGGWIGGTMLVASVYLRDVKPGGGGTWIWPGSHRAIARFFSAHPDRYLSGCFNNSWGIGSEFGENDLSQYGLSAQTSSVENTMDAGDVAFSHGMLVHTAVPNLLAGTVRVGVFSRWHHKSLGIIRSDVPSPTEMWKHWEGNAIQRAAPGLARL